MVWPPAQRAGGRHGYHLETISKFLRLVLVGGVSLRGASRVLAMQAPSGPTPCWTTGRMWLLRLGHAMLTETLQQADDWAWLVDHSVQIGQEKCLVIVGIRLANLPAPGECLEYRHLHLIALLPESRWRGANVDLALAQAAKRTGVPRAIVDDHGADLHGGVRLFQQRHPQTAEIYDTKHKAACLLKKRLAGDARWQAFQTRVGVARCAVQQTELACLAPPGPKPKARFMNLGPMLGWARHVLAVLREPARIAAFVTARRLGEKLGWIADFSEELSQWSQWQQVVDVAVTHAGQQGVYRGTARHLAAKFSQLPPLCHSARALAAELLRFARSQELRVEPTERFPASTEVLESCFGRFKQLEKQHARGGFTHLLLSFGALLADTTTTGVRHAMQASRTADVHSWAARNLGLTFSAKRRLAFSCATESG